MEDVQLFFRHLFGYRPARYMSRELAAVPGAKLHNICDLAIWAAYLAIPIVLFFLLPRKKEPASFRHMFWLFGIFILSCGMTHFMEFYTFQIPMYRLSGFIKLVTALSSWGTVFALIPITPIALAMRTPKELESEIRDRTSELESERAALAGANEELHRQIDERIRVEALLREEQMRVVELNMQLEQRVRERTTELEASNRELESFAHAVAHDLRAPLRSIDGFSHALMEELAPTAGPGSIDSLRRVRRATKRMDALITSLLTLSRLTRKELNRQNVDLSSMAEEVFDEIRLSEPSRDVEFLVTPGLTATGDSNLIRVLLTNLLSNAWKFTANQAETRIEFGKAPTGELFLRDNAALDSTWSTPRGSSSRLRGCMTTIASSARASVWPPASEW